MQNQQNVKKQVFSSLFWKFMERGGTQGIQFIVQIILARLLLPKDYGIVALISIFITLANVFVQSGFNTALIQKKRPDESDYSSVFYLSLIVAGLLYTLLFFTSPLIANFYEEPKLIPVLRIMAITLFFGAINSIQTAIVSRNMQFRKLFFSSLGAIISSGTIGIIMAYMGFGVWALVGQQLVYSSMTALILWFTVNWRPKLFFSLKNIKGLFSYGWKLLVSTLIGNLYMNVESLVIGKLYSAEILGFFNRGKQFPTLIVSNIDGPIQSVMLPAYSKQQDNKRRVKDMVRRSIVTSSFITFPLMVGLAIVAEPVIELLLTDKWLPSVPFLQIYCAAYAMHPIHTANLQAINALGRSDIYLKLELIKKGLGLALLGAATFFGVYAIAIGAVISGVVSTMINAYPNKKLLNYHYKEQMKDIVPSLILSLVMGAAVYVFHFIDVNTGVKFMLQIIVGILVYLGLAYLFKFECFQYLVENLKLFVKRKKNAKNA